MDTRAVYTVHENGKDFYFYSKYAGGFSYPFEAADYLRGLKDAFRRPRTGKQDICAAPFSTLMILPSFSAISRILELVILPCFETFCFTCPNSPQTGQNYRQPVILSTFSKSGHTAPHGRLQGGDSAFLPDFYNASGFCRIRRQ